MCFTEQYIGGKLGIKITIILPPEGMASFNAQMEIGNIKQIKANLTTFDVANARASVPADEVYIFTLSFIFDQITWKLLSGEGEGTYFFDCRV